MGSPSSGTRSERMLPVDVLHGEEVDAVGFLHREDGDDVGMVEAATIEASRRKRSSRSGLELRWGGRILIATSRPSLVSRAR